MNDMDVDIAMRKLEGSCLMCGKHSNNDKYYDGVFYGTYTGVVCQQCFIEANGIDALVYSSFSAKQ